MANAHLKSIAYSAASIILFFSIIGWMESRDHNPQECPDGRHGQELIISTRVEGEPTLSCLYITAAIENPAAN